MKVVLKSTDPVTKYSYNWKLYQLTARLPVYNVNLTHTTPKRINIILHPDGHFIVTWAPDVRSTRKAHAQMLLAARMFIQCKLKPYIKKGG